MTLEDLSKKYKNEAEELETSLKDIKDIKDYSIRDRRNDARLMMLFEVIYDIESVLFNQQK